MYRLIIEKWNDKTSIYARLDAMRPATFELSIPVATLRQGMRALQAHNFDRIVRLQPAYDALPPFLLSLPASHRYLTLVLREEERLFHLRAQWRPGSLYEIFDYPVTPDPHVTISSSETGTEYSRAEIPLSTLSYDEIRRMCNFPSYLPNPAATIVDALFANAARQQEEEEENGE